MKEISYKKEKKKKPGEFLLKKKKFKNIQHNRDQLKLLRERQISQAELFILDPDGFKKVTIIQDNELWSGTKVVFLYNRGKGSKLRTGYISDKDGFKVIGEPGLHIKPENIFGAVIEEVMLKKSDFNG